MHKGQRRARGCKCALALNTLTMKAIIIDDEEKACETLEVFLREYCPQVQLIGMAADGEAGLRLIKSKKPELVFLDIEMPDMSGIELLKRLGPTSLMVVFVTAYHNFAEKAFELSALDFLRKPVEPTRLVRAVHKATERKNWHHLQQQYETLIMLMSQALGANEQHHHPIVFSTQQGKIFKKVGSIVSIEAQNNACRIHLMDEAEPLHIFKTLKEYEQMLDSYPFMMRVHNSFIVNLYHVRRFVSADFVLEMTDHSSIPLAESRKAECLARLATLGRGT